MAHWSKLSAICVCWQRFHGRARDRQFSRETILGAAQLWGLGIFDRKLIAAQVLQHYELWTKNKGVELAGDAGIRTLYLFNEHAQSRAQVPSEPSLYIPEDYFVLH
jgi:hypothetical protein